jgi:Ca2+-binding EF-hand superfamily protein
MVNSCLFVLTAAKDAFKAFDKKNEDKIKVGDIESAMRRLGHNIKPDWLEKIEHMIDSEGIQCIASAPVK